MSLAAYGPYGKYKENTDIFTTWLDDTAKASGWKPFAQRTSRLKGEARKAAKKETSESQYAITTNELLDQIVHVAKAEPPANAMPPSIHRALVTAIQIRQRQADLIRDAGDETGSHRYFISVLEYGLEKLPKGVDTEDVDQNGVSKIENMFMCNPFDGLEIDHIEEDEEEEKISIAQEEMITTLPGSPSIDMDTIPNLAPTVFSFFEELQELREYVTGLWRQVFDGSMHITQATVLTLSCFEEVRRAESRTDDDELRLDNLVMLSAGCTLSKLVRLEWHRNPRATDFVKQDEFIRQLIIEMELNEIIGQRPETEGYLTAIEKLHVADKAYTTLQQVWTTGSVTTAAVFVAQTLWQIHTISNDKYLRFECAKLAKPKRTDTQEPGPNKGDDEQWDATRFNTDHMNEYKRVRLDAFKQNAKHLLKDSPVVRNPDPDFLEKANPLLPWIWLTFIRSLEETRPVAFANYDFSVFLASHLYNAPRKMGRCSTPWPELDEIMQYFVRPIFASEIPSGSNSIVSRFAYRLGLAGIGRERWKAKKAWVINCSPIAQVLRTSTSDFTGKDTRDFLPALTGLAETYYRQAKGTSVADAPRQRRPPWHQLSARQRLSKFEEYLELAIPMMEFDWASLTKRCMRFHMTTQNRLAEECGIDWRQEPKEGEPTGSHGPGFISMVTILLLMLARTEPGYRTLDRIQTDEEQRIMGLTKMMDIAVECLDRELSRQTKDEAEAARLETGVFSARKHL
ncbi:hypothetical protein GGR52DRAFT_576093 [Hypoxylon sp. FL1284]|nr:hypothetical protein GGR52DRAFT_576093 [Hypoxylon sp. FL1284]